MRAVRGFLVVDTTFCSGNERAGCVLNVMLVQRTADCCISDRAPWHAVLLRVSALTGGQPLRAEPVDSTFVICGGVEANGRALSRSMTEVDLRAPDFEIFDTPLDCTRCPASRF